MFKIHATVCPILALLPMRHLFSERYDRDYFVGWFCRPGCYGNIVHLPKVTGVIVTTLHRNLHSLWVKIPATLLRG